MRMPSETTASVASPTDEQEKCYGAVMGQLHSQFESDGRGRSEDEASSAECREVTGRRPGLTLSALARGYRRAAVTSCDRRRVGPLRCCGVVLGGTGVRGPTAGPGVVFSAGPGRVRAAPSASRRCAWRFHRSRATCSWGRGPRAAIADRRARAPAAGGSRSGCGRRWSGRGTASRTGCSSSITTTRPIGSPIA